MKNEIRRVNFLSAPFKNLSEAPNFVGFVEEKNPNPLFENPPSLGGEGRGGEKWDVDKWIMNFPTMICQGLIAESELKQGLKSRVISKT